MTRERDTNMSAGEYVVIQVWSKSYDSAEASWLDYSRCTASQALSFLADRNRPDTVHRYRAVHWIYSEIVLNDRQLREMAQHGRTETYAGKPPARVVELSEAECAIVGSVLFDALCDTREDQWSDYALTVETLRKVASPHILRMWEERER